MFSQDPIVQKAQMEALAFQVEYALTLNQMHMLTGYGYSPTQDTIQAQLASFTGSGGKISPEHRVLVLDQVEGVRAEYGTIHDYLAPLTATNKNMPGQTSSVRDVFMRSSVRWFLVGDFYTSTLGTYETRTKTMYLDNSTEQYYPSGGTLDEVVSINPNGVIDQVVTVVNGTNILRKGALSATTTTSISVDVGFTRPVVAILDNSRNVYFRDDTNPDNVQKRTHAGVTSTVYTGFSGVAGGLMNLFYDATSNKLILISGISLSTTTAAYKMDVNGTNLTLLIPAGLYAAGRVVAGYKHIGVEVKNGKVYAPVPGSPYLTRRRVYDIIAGTYVEEDFDFGDAKTALEEVVKEAKHIVEHSMGGMTQQRAYWGADFFAYVFERLVHAQRTPANDGYLLTYETGPLSAAPGAGIALVWSVLPDNGSSGKVYPLTETIDPRSDFRVVKEITYDVAVKEMSLDWSSDLGMQDFGTLVIEFDNGLTTATENIRIQFNGDTAANYALTFYRGSAATIVNSAVVAQTQLELYGVNTGAVLGGKYILTFVDHMGSGAPTFIGGLVEGVTALGVATTNVNSVLGVCRWSPGGLQTVIQSVRIFLSGSTAFFAAGAKLRILAYRTRGVYSATTTPSNYEE